MKKMVKFLFIICALFITNGCKKENDKEVSLIELNMYELVDLFDSEEKILFTIFNDNNSTSTNALRSQVESYQRITNNCVYYVNTTDLQGIELEYFNILTGEDPYEPRVYVIDNGNIVLDKDSSITYQELKVELGDEDFTEIDLNDFKENREKNYNTGVEYLEKGSIGKSYYYFYMAKPQEKATQILEEENKFNLLNRWEYLQEEDGNCDYLTLMFVKGDDLYYQATYNGKCEKLDKDKLKTTKYNYTLIDDKIMAKEENDKDYQEKFTIDNLDSNNLKISSGSKTYNLKVNE
ncbi:MAG: hypothetical protein ACI31M_03755 [Bacilli bacterium]